MHKHAFDTLWQAKHASTDVYRKVGGEGSDAEDNSNILNDSDIPIRWTTCGTVAEVYETTIGGCWQKLSATMKLVINSTMADILVGNQTQ
jgi:hypothetical protein